MIACRNYSASEWERETMSQERQALFNSTSMRHPASVCFFSHYRSSKLGSITWAPPYYVLLLLHLLRVILLRPNITNCFWPGKKPSEKKKRSAASLPASLQRKEIFNTGSTAAVPSAVTIKCRLTLALFTGGPRQSLCHSSYIPVLWSVSNRQILHEVLYLQPKPCCNSLDRKTLWYLLPSLHGSLHSCKSCGWFPKTAQNMWVFHRNCLRSAECQWLARYRRVLLLHSW